MNIFMPGPVVFLEFIYGHLKENSGFNCTEQVSRRYRFYELGTYLASNDEWSAAAFQDVLDTVIELVTSISFELCIFLVGFNKI